MTSALKPILTAITARQPIVHQRSSMPAKTVKNYAKHHSIDIDPIDSCTNVWPPKAISNTDPFDDHYAQTWDEAAHMAHTYACISLGINPDRSSLIHLRTDKLQRTEELLAALALRCQEHAQRLNQLRKELASTHCLTINLDNPIEALIAQAISAKHHISAKDIATQLASANTAQAAGHHIH